jgi:hypothetical protein
MFVQPNEPEALAEETSPKAIREAVSKVTFFMLLVN